MSKEYNLYTDGGARGNPGPGAVGIAILKGDKVVFSQGKYLGDSITNNQAEYRAILGGLGIAKKMGIKELKCFLDSELVVKQLKGEYKVKDVDLKVLFEKVKKIEPDFIKISFNHIRREKNKLADSLVNEALDRGVKK
uniref:Ribonuclease HI family protein n=1 Tax=candidate division CPR3 bacterium TaxID=2268181 RepID=A0A7C4R9V8_UNCC3